MLRFALLFSLLLATPLPLLAAEPGHPYDSPNIFGEAIWIGEGEERFPALYARASVPEPKGVIIMLHAEGEHPQWPMVVLYLREYLTDHGWNTLSLQLPTPIASDRDLDRKAYGEKVGRQIQMAMDYVMPMDPPAIVLLGHGLGANAVLQRAAEKKDDRLMAVVAISVDASAPRASILNTREHLARLSLPILDIYAERDRLEVLNSVQVRSRAARRAGNKHYRQLEIPGADHHFYRHTAMLGSRIKSWLDATYKTLSKEMEAKDKGEPRADEMVPPPPPAEPGMMPAPAMEGEMPPPPAEPGMMPPPAMEGEMAPPPAMEGERVPSPTEAGEPMPSPQTPMPAEGVNPTGTEGLF